MDYCTMNDNNICTDCKYCISISNLFENCKKECIIIKYTLCKELDLF